MVRPTRLGLILVRPTRLVCRGPQTLKAHLCGFALQKCHSYRVYIHIRPGGIARFARFCATKCYSSRAYMYVGPGGIARFARFCATKCYSSRTYINIDPGGIAFARFFCAVCPCQPRSFDWFAQPAGFPSTPNPNQKGLEQTPGIPPLRNVSKPFFLVFFCAKTGPIKLPRKRGGLKSASKNQFFKG